MDFDFYGNAVKEYMTEFAENTRKVLKRIKIPQAEIELQIQEEKERIEKLTIFSDMVCFLLSECLCCYFILPETANLVLFFLLFKFAQFIVPYPH